MSEQHETQDDVAAWPAWAAGLAALFGPPSSEGFGSAVFHDGTTATTLPDAARAMYRRFVGDLWDRWGEDAWMGPWREVHAREGAGDVAAELRGLTDAEAARSVSLILEHPAGADVIEPALVEAFGGSDVTDFRIFNIGDGEAMSGLLLAARRAAPAGDVYLAVLMD